MTSFLNDVRSAAKHAARPLSESAFSKLRGAADGVLEAFEYNLQEGAAFKATLKYTMPALLQIVADTAFGLGDARFLSKAKAAFTAFLDELRAAQPQEVVAKALPRRLEAFVDACSDELRDESDRVMQRQLVQQQYRPAGGTEGQASHVFQPSSVPNRQARRPGICYDWDGVRCHGKGRDCPFDHPLGRASSVFLKRRGMVPPSRGSKGY